jgi:succinate dehydrogenase / fumarate reductase, cytochrome b subunit
MLFKVATIQRVILKVILWYALRFCKLVFAATLARKFESDRSIGLIACRELRREAFSLASEKREKEKREFFARRIHSLMGVIPVGLFLIEHFFTNSEATRGVKAFNDAVAVIQGLPFLPVIEFLFIFLPILYHGVYGMYIAFTSGYNSGAYGWFRNWMFVLQRITGVITFIFIVYHLWTTRFSGQAPSFDMVANLVSHPFTFWFMIIGIISASFHFLNGLWSFLVHWGITIGPRAQKVSAYVMAVLFLIMSYVGVAALVAFTHQA